MTSFIFFISVVENNYIATDAVVKVLYCEWKLKCDFLLFSFAVQYFNNVTDVLHSTFPGKQDADWEPKIGW